ncbi:hypothetical protein D7Y41_02350 [Anaerotruncus sp. 1XD22-93]|nr:hypothetical protein [Lachnospiraceae bacterium]RKK00314.1 hypothetical protein D7Y41_02350 [Anaerotruncus sp. 1XD22-93]
MKKMKRFMTVVMIAIAIMLVLPFRAEAAPKLSKKKITLTVKKSATLSVKGSNKKKVQWKTSHKKVVQIKKTKKQTSVKLVAKKKGTAKITATVGKKKLTCKVTVKAKKSVKPSETPATPSKPSDNPVKPSQPSNPNTPNKPSTGGTGTGIKDIVIGNGTLDYPGKDNKYYLGYTATTEEAKEYYMNGVALTGDGKPTGLITGMYGKELHNGDTFFIYKSSRDDYDDPAYYRRGEIMFPEGISVEQISWEITNNKTADGDGHESVLCILVYEDYDGYPAVQCFGLREGTADLTVSAKNDAGNVLYSVTVHVDNRYVDLEYQKYYGWLEEMVNTPVGTTKYVTINDENIRVDGAQGADDVETLMNVGAWIADHKIHTGTGPMGDDPAHFYRDSCKGGDCGDLNQVIADAATVLGHTGWETLVLGMGGKIGHIVTKAVVGDVVCRFDAGVSGTKLPRSFVGFVIDKSGNQIATYFNTGYGGCTKRIDS